MRVAKYDPLRLWLTTGSNPVTVRFDQIASLVGGLPPSAYRHLEWWSNEERGRHVQARAWMDAGRRVLHVDLVRQTVAFSDGGVRSD